MTDFTFADIYRSAQFTLQPANMALREKSAQAFLGQFKFDDVIGLVRLHFGIQTPSYRDRLVEVFRTDDPTFSIVDGEREITVLSTGLLASIIRSPSAHAALSLVTGSFAGHRVAEIAPHLSEWAKEKLISILNERYNNDRITVITTNFIPTRSLMGDDHEERKDLAMSESQRRVAKCTLGDRITDRMLSRLDQMCLPVGVYGTDMRSTVMKARA